MTCEGQLPKNVLYHFLLIINFLFVKNVLFKKELNNEIYIHVHVAIQDVR